MKDKNKNEKNSSISSSKKEDIQINRDKNKDKKSTNSKKPSQNNDKYLKIGNYLIKETLGRGTFGKVKLGIYLPENKKVAIKILEKKSLKMNMI